MSATASVERLVAALNAEADPAEWIQRSRVADSDRLVVSAIVLGVAPLFHWTLTRWGTSLSAGADAKLESARRAAASRQEAIELQLAGILRPCTSANIPIIILKGAYLACCVYPERGLRPMNDIDLLLQPQHLPAVESLLAELGYVGHYKSPHSGARVTKHTSTFRRHGPPAATPNPYLTTEGERTVEPHTSLEESWFGLRADITPGVWERSLPAVVGGLPARALCPPDLMLHVCIHLTFHLIMGWPSLVQLVDVLMLSRRLGAEDWAVLIELARDRRVAGFVYAALRLAKTTLKATVPAEVISGLVEATAPRVRAHAESLSLTEIMQRTQRPPLTSIGQRLHRGFQDRAEAARWASSIKEQTAVWRTLLEVSRTDTAKLVVQRLRPGRPIA